MIRSLFTNPLERKEEVFYASAPSAPPSAFHKSLFPRVVWRMNVRCSANEFNQTVIEMQSTNPRPSEARDVITRGDTHALQHIHTRPSHIRTHMKSTARIEAGNSTHVTTTTSLVAPAIHTFLYVQTETYATTAVTIAAKTLQMKRRGPK